MLEKCWGNSKVYIQLLFSILILYTTAFLGKCYLIKTKMHVLCKLINLNKINLQFYEDLIVKRWDSRSNVQEREIR